MFVSLPHNPRILKFSTPHFFQTHGIKWAMCLLVMLCLHRHTNAQNHLDSLKSIWRDAGLRDEQRFDAINTFYVLNTFENPAASMEVTAEHLKLAGQYQNLRQTIKAFNERAIIYSLTGKTDSSLFYIREAVGIAEQLHDTLLIGKMYVNYGNALREAGQLREAVKSYFDGQFLLESKHPTSRDMADVNHNLGTIYYDLGLYEIARPYFKRALDLYILNNQVSGVGNIWLNSSEIDYKLGEMQDAKWKLSQAMASLRNESNKYSLSSAHVLAAALCEADGQTDSADYHLNIASEIRKELGNANQIVEVYVLKTEFALRNQWPISNAYKKMILENLGDVSSLQTKAMAYRLLHKLCKMEGNDAQALSMLELHTICTDSLNVERDKFAIIREAIQSDYDNKILQTEVQNARLKAEEELRRLKWIFGLSLGAVFLFLAIVWYVRRLMQSNALEREQLLREVDRLKTFETNSQQSSVSSFELNREKLEQYLKKKLNETDWAVLNVLVKNPVVSNKELAESVFLSTDGAGSALRRLYAMFDVPESKYMKISLLLTTIKISNSTLSKS